MLGRLDNAGLKEGKDFGGYSVCVREGGTGFICQGGAKGGGATHSA